MAHFLFHNNTVDLNHLWYESHRNLITSICMELGAVDKAEELTQKYLADKLKIKAQKDPNKPKRAKSAWMFFCDANRGKVRAKLQKKKKKNEKVKIPEVSKTLGTMWSGLNDIKKHVYVELSNKDKIRYEEEMEAYTGN